MVEAGKETEDLGISPPIERKQARKERVDFLPSTLESAALIVEDKRGINHECSCTEFRSYKGKQCGLYVITSGVTASESDKEASQLVIETVNELTSGEIMNSKRRPPEHVLEDAVVRANEEIFKNNKEEKAEMRVTATAVLIVDKKLHYAHVGDGRACLIPGEREEDIRQLTHDHTFEAKAVEDGEMTLQQLYEGKRFSLNRFLGGEAEVEIETGFLSLKQGDRVLLCTPEAYRPTMVPDPRLRGKNQKEFENILRSRSRKNTPSKICSDLSEFAKDSGVRKSMGFISVMVK